MVGTSKQSVPGMEVLCPYFGGICPYIGLIYIHNIIIIYIYIYIW